MRQPRFLVVVVACAGLIATLPQSSLAQKNGETGGKQILVQILVNTAYDDSEASLKQISTLIKGLPVRRVQFGKNDNPSSLILREYGISTYKHDAASYLPKTYKLIEQTVLSMNGVNRPEELRHGRIRIPELPRKALEDPNAGNPLNSIPILSVISASAISVRKDPPTNVADLEFVGTADVSSLGRPAAQNHLLDLSFSAAFAKKILNEPAFQKAVTGVFNYPMTMTLGAEDNAQDEIATVDHLVLSEAQRRSIQDLLATNAQREVLVFILDTGWPDATSYADSKRTLHELVRFTQQQFFGRELAKIPDSKPFVEPSNAHCKYVSRALAELRKLDSKDHIKIIYVPLTKEQNAAPLLTELLQTEYVRGATKYSEKQLKVPKDLLKRSRAAAENTVRTSYPDKWNGNEIDTDKSILDAILDLGNSYAKEKNTVFFVNESWTVPHDEYHVYYPTTLYGVVLAAAGNAGINITAAQLDFADRSTSHKDTLAVMNLRPGLARLPCNSSYISEKVVDKAMAVAFDGEVVGTTICGTSFAAPRIAWILAADEAVRKAALDPTTWEADLDERLKKARDPNATKFDKLWFDPVVFLKLSTP
jgi:hypothetical protein